MLIFIITWALLVVRTLWVGFIASTMWLWFVVPVFGTPALSVMGAIGLVVLADLVLHGRGSIPKIDPNDIEWFDLVFDAFAHPGFYFFIGWVVHKFL